jgi:hypothetical protein
MTVAVGLEHSARAPAVAVGLFLEAGALMAAVRMYITKFAREVLIDDQHPLARAERAGISETSGTIESEAVTADTHLPDAATVSVSLDPATDSAVPRRRRGKKA